jgi:ferredoxin
MITSEMIKKRARDLGADVVGIGNIERWEGAPLQMDPRQVMPEARSVIGLVFRVCRGSLRGIEEGTFFSNYSSMGYGGITYVFLPMVVMNLARFIEDDGYEAVPYGHQSDWRAIDNEGAMRPNYSVPVAPGRAAPDVMVQLRIAAFLCGLGEIGFSKMFLSPQFGPRNRVGIIITEAELEPDPLYEGPPLCNRCLRCVKECPGGALKANKTVKVKLAGREVEWTDIDCKACDIAFRGGQPAREVLTGKDSYMEEPMYGKWLKPGWWSPFFRKPSNLYNTGQAVCGARGCTRACMASLEERGVLLNKFHKPFRRQAPWRVDWSNTDWKAKSTFDPVTGKKMAD